MKLSLLRLVDPSVAAAFLVLSLPSLAQESKPAAKLVPGSADVIHDVSGIAIGMKCQDAIEVATKIAAPGFKYNFAKSRGGATLDGRRIEYDYSKYRLPIRVINKTFAVDNLEFSCVDGAEGGEVFELTRKMVFMPKFEAGPSVASLPQLFEEKYGVPTLKINNLIMATMFNKKGVVQREGDYSCIKVENGHLYERSFLEFDANKCSYALTFSATEARDPPGSVSEISIFIRDYLRLENGVRAMEKKRLETTPVAAPKL